MGQSGLDSSWFVIREPKPWADVRLICLPYAGGTAATYAPWSRFFDNAVEIVAVQLPGRADRFDERPYSSMASLVAALLSRLQDLHKPYVLFGHSLGGRIGFELLRRMHLHGLPLPLHFIASGSAAPHIPERKPHIYRLPDEQFIAELRTYGGTPEEVLSKPEIMELYLPMLRADFQIAETYGASPERRYECPASVFFGSEDRDISRENACAWQEHFAGEIEVVEFAGGHFFLDTHRHAVLRKLKDIVGKACADAASARRRVPHS